MRLVLPIFVPALVLISSPVHADELDLYLASQQKLLDENGLAESRRAGIAREMAAALDRSAARAKTADERRSHWERAIGILDRFTSVHPRLREGRELKAQAAVFQWAVGASWLGQSRLDPKDSKLRDKAADALDQAVERFQALRPASDDQASPLDRQIRLRFARALRDRAGLDPDGSRLARERLTEALDVLGDVSDFGPLGAPAGIEKARILLALGRLDEAQAQVDELMKEESKYDPDDLLDTQVRTLLARKQFDKAEKVLDDQPSLPATHRLRLELALARWEAARTEGDSEAQKAAEAAAFSEMRGLQQQEGNEAAEALLRLSAGLTRPSSALSAEDLDLLAQGRLRWGRPEEASGLDVRASEAARMRGDDRQAATYRLKAAGILLRSDHPAQARHLLDQIAEDRSAGDSRAKAALLSALSRKTERGRSLRPDERKAYESALERVIERFPDSSEAGEALWVLGLARKRDDDVAGALALWERIPEEHPRWLEAQLARASLQTDEIASVLAEGDERSAEQERQEVREALDRVEAKVKSDSGRADLALTRARLETLPNLGDPKRAVDEIDRLLTQPLKPARRGEAERLRVLALLELGRSVEAMRETRSLLETSGPADLLELARKLDQAAVSAPSDLLVRRFGEVLRLVASHLVAHPGSLDPSQRAEGRLRLLRGQVFHGDSGAAREGLKNWPDALDALAPEVQADLASLALDAGEAQRALEVNRAMARRHPSGSKPWFQARLGEAEALLELRETENARRLLDATEILHPEIGGERLRRQYEALRERLEREQAFRPDR